MDGVTIPSAVTFVSVFYIMGHAGCLSELCVGFPACQVLYIHIKEQDDVLYLRN
jgi:hypothetical protein